jgi:hypothetical protein
MAPLGVFDVSVFFTFGCGAAQQAEPEEAGGEQHQRARFGGRRRSRSRQGGVIVEIPLRRGAGADQLCAVVVDTQEITVVGGDEQMPVPIHCGLVEFVAGVRIRKRGNDCPARRVELVYFVTAVEDDVASVEGGYPESSRGAAVGRGPIILLWGSRIRPLTRHFSCHIFFIRVLRDNQI